MGKIRKELLEEWTQEYFATITEKPILCIEVARMERPMIELSVENMIVLYLLDSFHMYKIFDVRAVFAPEQEEDEGRGLQANKEFSSAERSNDNNVSSNFVMYESEMFFQEESIKTCGDDDGKIWDEGGAEAVEYNCKNPSVHLPQNKMHIAGLSAVLRFLIRFAYRRQDMCENDPFVSLLGQRTVCLQACAETSIWTRFCEVDMIQMVYALQEQLLGLVRETANSCLVDEEIAVPSLPPLRRRRGLLEIPKDLLRFEYHLTRPVRIHNFRKWIQNHGSKEPAGNNQGRNHQESMNRGAQAAPPHPRDIPHDFAEGPDLSLSDFILFPCVDLALVVLGMELFKKYLPTVYEWHQRLCGHVPFRPRFGFQQELSSPQRVHLRLEEMLVQVPEIPQESLYKSDPLRYNPKSRLFTKQHDIEEALRFLSSQGIQTLHFNDEKMPAFEWDSLPLLVHPEDGQLPLSRIQRKAQQLSNLAQQVQKVYRDKYEDFHSTLKKVTIVDFCSGGGHLGILLAYLLPKCEIILVENKEESIRRATTRVKLLNLENVSFYQCNLDYFIGQFEIGVALHACGTATDLVLAKCVQQKASFVVSPCCYGGIRSNHILHYPRSSTFSVNFRDDSQGGDDAPTVNSSPLTLKHYFVLSHAADQTHNEANEKTRQGEVCMQMIDTDRCFQVQEHDYQTNLCRMDPSTCSPKNHILVGSSST